MSIPASRDEFKDYCRRALGEPVLQVNVDDQQAEDRIDQALYKYQQYHMDAVVKTFIKHEITSSVATLTGPSAGTFANGELMRGATSNAVGTVVHQSNTTTVLFFTVGGTFANGEIITGSQSAATGTVGNLVLGDMDNHYFAIPDDIIAVTRMFPPFDGRLAADILFDPNAQFNMSLMSNFTSNSIIPYVMGRQYQTLLSDTFRGRPQIRFQRHQNRLYADVGFLTTFRPGQFIVIECFQTLDPGTYPDVWSDEWLQRYATALIKRQWGTNLSKYNGIALPGGVTLDGKSMYADAVIEIKELEEELRNTYQLPIDFIVG